MYSDESEDDRWLEALAGRVDPDANSFEVVQATAIRAALLQRRDEIEAEEARLSHDRLQLIKASLLKEGFLVERKSGLIGRAVDFFKSVMQPENKALDVKSNTREYQSKSGQNIDPIYPPLARPAVWRNNRSGDQAKADKLASGGLDDLEIPAFLRRQEGNQDPKPSASKSEGAQSALGDASEPVVSIQTNLGQTVRWVEILPQLESLMRDFDIAAATSPNFRISLIKTLRDKNTGYIMWLWSNHVGITKASVPIWAVFIAWLDEKSEFHLGEQAKKQVGDFLDSLDRSIVLAIRDDLNRTQIPLSWLKK